MPESLLRDAMVPVDILIPVYRGLSTTRRCIESVLATTPPEDARVIVIDDASPEIELSRWLDEQSAAGRFVLLRNTGNLGFAGAVNRGLQEHSTADVVLLNSDTEVPANWLQRLLGCAATATATKTETKTPNKVATVTPFSNNATICSYPFFCEPAELPSGLDLATLDSLFAEVNAGQSHPLPTGVGFCMWVSRKALQQLGGLDESAYQRGYGEENDFCRRAEAAGWSNLLCADLFVYHAGAASFGEERHELMQAGNARLVERFPDYPEVVARFIAEDPLRALRDGVDAARLTLPGQAAVVLQERRQARDRLQQKALDLLERERLCDGLGREIETLREGINEYQQRCAAYDQRCADYDARCEEYENLLAQGRATLAARDAAFASLEDQARSWQQDLEQVQRELESVYASRYWRYGSWLRKWIK